jgi:hypothetical protein
MTRLRSSRGQTLIEFTLVMPLILVLMLGVVEVGYALVDQHVVTKISREGANLISRNATIDQALVALRNMSTRPVDFTDGARVIFSVIRKGATVNTPNYGETILLRRFEYGTIPGQSEIRIAGSGTFTGADHTAVASDFNTGLQITTLPSGLANIPIGGMVYVTEIYARHERLTPLHNFGISVPETLYSIAYF